MHMYGLSVHMLSIDGLSLLTSDGLPWYIIWFHTPVLHFWLHTRVHTGFMPFLQSAVVSHP